MPARAQHDTRLHDPIAAVDSLVSRALVSLVAGGRVSGPLSDARDLTYLAPLRDACRAARDQGMQAEELLILLKQRWRTTDDSRAVDRDIAEAALSRVITRCIEEYYRTDAIPIFTRASHVRGK